jgi:hypothetical protein
MKDVQVESWWRSSSLLVLGFSAAGMVVAPGALAQPVGAGLHKDESVPEGEEVLEETELEDKYTIKFGEDKDWIKLKSG